MVIVRAKMIALFDSTCSYQTLYTYISDQYEDLTHKMEGQSPQKRVGAIQKTLFSIVFQCGIAAAVTSYLPSRKIVAN